MAENIVGGVASTHAPSFLAHTAPKVGLSYRGTHWDFFSPRLQRRVIARSSLEFDHYVQIEMNPEVRSWEPQFEAVVTVPGAGQKCVFDSKVIYWHGKTVVSEVCHQSNMSDSRTAERKWLQDAWCSQNKAESVWATETSIRENITLLENCNNLLPWLQHLHSRDDSLTQSVIGVVVGTSQQICVQDISRKLNVAPEILVPIIAAQFIERRFLMDIARRRFGLGTSVSLRPQP